MSAELTFILAMGLWPEVQRKAQEELDAVVGHDRLPTYADIARMPYLNAIYLETLLLSTGQVRSCFPVSSVHVLKC